MSIIIKAEFLLCVLLDAPGVGHQGAQTVVQILDALTDIVDTLHHLVGLVVGKGGGGLPAVLSDAGNLAQVVILIGVVCAVLGILDIYATAFTGWYTGMFDFTWPWLGIMGQC